MFGVLMITLLLTISLVGSNMDTILKQGIIYQVRAEITENTTIAQGFNDPDAVSYTHLTLPTIYSV